MSYFFGGYIEKKRGYIYEDWCGCIVLYERKIV